MIVVADTGPIHYLVLIGAVDVLTPLYGRVLVPQTVVEELKHAGAPSAVRAWIAQPPAWLEIRSDPPSDPTVAFEPLPSAKCVTMAASIWPVPGKWSVYRVWGS